MTLPCASRILERRGMAGHAELVSVGIAKVRAVVVLVVLRAQPRRALTGAAIGQRKLVGLPDGRPGRRREGNHLPIAGVVRLAVMGLADDEERAHPAGAVPAGPWPLRLAESQLDAKALHHGP